MVSLFKSDGTPDALVFVFSDLQGWDAAHAGVARMLARHGAVVVGVDLPQYLRNLAASKDGCHYLVAEIEDMSERLQRDFRFAGYQSPILAGIGPGGTLAYAALAQSPAATIGGAISVDPAPALGTKVPLCAGAPAQAAERGGFGFGAQPTNGETPHPEHHGGEADDRGDLDSRQTPHRIEPVPRRGATEHRHPHVVRKGIAEKRRQRRASIRQAAIQMAQGQDIVAGQNPVTHCRQ
jgi:type IV secretory pathway VirJ component